MKSREMTILAIAMGAWMTWRLIGSSLLPVARQEIAIAIIVLFKPWLDFRGWISLLTINAISWIHVWYNAWTMVASLLDEKIIEARMVTGLAYEGFGSSYPPIWMISLIVLTYFIYLHFILPYIWERVYLKTGVWGKLKWGK